MKKIPSIRMPDPKAGVVRSEHPRAVGLNGLVESSNWILRDGSVQVRDGIKFVSRPSRDLITPGTSWEFEGNDVWSTGLATEPDSVWFDSTVGTKVLTPSPIAEFEWRWGPSKLYIYALSDPDGLYIAPGIQWAVDDDASSVIALESFDYQGQDDSDVQGVVRDQLLVVQDSNIVCCDNTLGVISAVTEEDTDWAWDGFYGPDATEKDEWQLTQKISASWSGINWTPAAGDYSYGIRLSFSFYTLAGITVELWRYDDAASVHIDTAEWVLSGTNSSLLSYSEYQQGVPYQIESSTGVNTGIYIIFNDDWNSWYDEANATGDSIGNVKLQYVWSVTDASAGGLPGDQTSVMDLDRTLRPVVRTWDYEQVTHNIIAVEDKFMLDVDSDALADSPVPTVATSGDTGVCPRAKTIGIAAQRIIAGNVSYFDSQLTAETGRGITAGYLENSNPTGVNWEDVVDQFAYFPDAVVYSGTVLTGGHKTWYPGDILRLADTPGEIVASQEMGTQMIAIYKTDAIYTLSSQSGVSPFAPSLRASGMEGPVSSRSVVAISDTTHLYLARDGGLYMFSGATPKSLGDQFKSWISREIDPEYSHLSFMIYDPERNEVHAYYPVRGAAGVVRKGMVVDTSKQPFTGWPVLWPKQIGDGAGGSEQVLKDWDILCATMHFEGSQDVKTSDITIPASEAEASPTTKYQELYLGTENEPLASPRTGVGTGRIFKTADIGNDHGVPIKASMESGISDLNDPDGQKVLLEIEFLFDNIPDVSVDATQVVFDVTIYAGDSNKKLSQVFTESDIEMASGQITVHPRVRGRYFSYKIDISAPMDVDWLAHLGEIEYYGAIARFKPSGVRQN